MYKQQHTFLYFISCTHIPSKPFFIITNKTGATSSPARVSEMAAGVATLHRPPRTAAQDKSPSVAPTVFYTLFAVLIDKNLFSTSFAFTSEILGSNFLLVALIV
ncbi:hypothetical protein B5X24_HaOG210068 [Helicoverpa armigera]|nr:hypothetical protein B5X24_HaOG210068 [Helicoverpa armigera]